MTAPATNLDLVRATNPDPPTSTEQRPQLRAVDTAQPRLGRRRAVKNNKGGVGKSTLLRELACALARRGRHVLAVDMDPQGNLTRRLGVTVDIFDGQPTLTHALKQRRRGGAADIVVPCGLDTPEAALIDVLPADLGLEVRAKEAAEPGAHNRLRRILYGTSDLYDYTLIDCRPALGHLEELVIAALDGDGDGYYLVVEPGHDAISGAYRVMTTVRGWAEALEIAAPPLGVIVNLTDIQTVLHQSRIQGLAEALTDPDRPAPPILQPYIPRTVHLAEAQDQATPISTDRRLTRDLLDPHSGAITRESVQTRFDALAQQVDQ